VRVIGSGVMKQHRLIRVYPMQLPVLMYCLTEPSVRVHLMFRFQMFIQVVRRDQDDVGDHTSPPKLQ
jgi:hypothetical protein